MRTFNGQPVTLEPWCEGFRAWIPGYALCIGDTEEAALCNAMRQAVKSLAFDRWWMDHRGWQSQAADLYPYEEALNFDELLKGEWPFKVLWFKCLP